MLNNVRVCIKLLKKSQCPICHFFSHEVFTYNIYLLFFGFALQESQTPLTKAAEAFLARFKAYDESGASSQLQQKNWIRTITHGVLDFMTLAWLPSTTKAYCLCPICLDKPSAGIVDATLKVPYHEQCESHSKAYCRVGQVNPVSLIICFLIGCSQLCSSCGSQVTPEVIGLQ